MSTRPLIAIVLDDDPGDAAGFSRRPYYALRKDYFAAIEAAGGVPFGVGYDQSSATALMAHAQGWLIPGGNYRFPRSWYDDEPPPAALLKSSERGAFESWLVPHLLDADRPVLGICNGMQVLAAMTGGRIAYRPHTHHVAPPDGYAQHDVIVAEGSRLAALVGAGRHHVNSAHRECVTAVGADVVVSARDDDGLIEAIELPHRRFALGVQWHPELLSETGMIKGLIAAARAGV